MAVHHSFQSWNLMQKNIPRKTKWKASVYQRALPCTLHYLIFRIVLQSWKSRYDYFCFPRKEAESTQGFKDTSKSPDLVKESTRMEGRSPFFLFLRLSTCTAMPPITHCTTREKGTGSRSTPHPPTKCTLCFLPPIVWMVWDPSQKQETVSDVTCQEGNWNDLARSPSNLELFLTRVLDSINQWKLNRGQTRNSGKAFLGFLLKQRGARTNKKFPCLLAPGGGGGELVPYMGWR